MIPFKQREVRYFFLAVNDSSSSKEIHYSLSVLSSQNGVVQDANLIRPVYHPFHGRFLVVEGLGP